MVDFNLNMLDAVSNGVLLAMQQIGVALPGVIVSIIVAAIALVVGVLVSDFLGKLAAKIMDYFNVEKIFKKYKVEDALGGTQITHLFALFVQWFVMLFFLQYALLALNFGAVSLFLTQLLLYVPAVFGVVLLVIVAAILGEWVREAIIGVHKFYLQQTIATASKWIIVASAVMVGLDTMGFHLQFVYLVINTVLQGLVYGVALAVGLAFGLGGQKDAADMIKKARKKFSV